MTKKNYRKLTLEKKLRFRNLLARAKESAYELMSKRKDHSLIELISTLEEDLQDVGASMYDTHSVDKLIVLIADKKDLIKSKVKKEKLIEFWLFLQSLRGEYIVNKLLPSKALALESVNNIRTHVTMSDLDKATDSFSKINLAKTWVEKEPEQDNSFSKINLAKTWSEKESEQKRLIRIGAETEQRVIEQTQRLFEEAQRSIQSKVDDGNEAIRSTLQSVRDELGTHANRAEAQIQKLVSKAEHQNKLHQADLKESFKAYEEDAANRIEVRIQRAEGIAANLSKQATDAKELYENIISEEKESLHTFITESQSTINDSIRKTAADASQRIQNAQTETQESFDSHLNEIIGTINKRIDDKISHYDEMKKEMEAAFQDKIQTLDRQLSIVTSGVMADQHLKQANTERYVYWVFQVAGFAFMLAAIYAGSVFFSELTNIKIPFLPKPDLVIHIDGSLNNGANPISLMFMRLSMIILLTAPALYLLKEAAGHRHKENLYRQRGIQLATISPYLEELEKEERAAIKKELVSSFFNFHDGKADTQNVPDFLRDMKEAVGIAKSLNGQNKTVSQRFGRQPKQ